MGGVDLCLHGSAKVPGNDNCISFEDQSILDGELVPHAKVRVCQCRGILLVIWPSEENGFRQGSQRLVFAGFLSDFVETFVRYWQVLDHVHRLDVIFFFALEWQVGS